ncbi:MAG: ferrous iron transport protein A [Clostridia bacterium]|nr:ferrous iron transport protein A [Clostridia bacterium]
MPLSLAAVGQSSVIKRIGGSADVKKHLKDLGFVPGCEITVVSFFAGDLIVSVKGARIAISRETAQRITV